MKPAYSPLSKPVIPSATDTRIARESSLQLTSLPEATTAGVIRMRIESETGAETTVSIPASAFELLNKILREMSLGNAVTLLPMQAELSTQQAADLLNISRPFLIELLNQGAIPYRKVGTHRRLLAQDVLTYQQVIEQKRLQALQELSALDQEIGLGY